MTNRFNAVTLEAIKRSAKIPDTASDVDIKRAIQAASDVMPRQFYVTVGERFFSAKDECSLLLKGHDLISVSELKTDDGTRTYPYTWDPDHFDLEPYSAPFENPPHPYWKINRVPNLATYSFPCGLNRGGLVTGEWGFYKVFSPTTVTIDMSPGGLLIGGTSLTLSAPNVVETGHTLAIEDEQVFVTAVAGAVATIEREVNGTTAAAHAHNTTVQVYTYPLVEQAALFLVQRYLRRTEDAPFGVIGSIDGFMRLAINDPDVLGLVGRLFRVGV